MKAGAGTRCCLRHLSDPFQPLICIHLRDLIPAEVDLKKLVCAATTASHCEWGCTFIIVMKPSSCLFFFFFLHFHRFTGNKGGCRDRTFVYATLIRENKWFSFWKIEATFNQVCRDINLGPLSNVCCLFQNIINGELFWGVCIQMEFYDACFFHSCGRE